VTGAATLLARLHGAGATVTLRDGRPVLRADWPIDSGLVAEAKAARSELIALLSLPTAAPPTPTLDAIPSDGATCATCNSSGWWQPAPGAEWHCIRCHAWPDGWP
jgi:hypothetical protein